MFLTASAELAPGSWVDVALTQTVGMPGILVLVYVSAIMFVMRHFAGRARAPLLRHGAAVHLHDPGGDRPLPAEHRHLAGHRAGRRDAVGVRRLLHVADDARRLGAPLSARRAVEHRHRRLRRRAGDLFRAAPDRQDLRPGQARDGRRRGGLRGAAAGTGAAARCWPMPPSSRSR